MAEVQTVGILGAGKLGVTVAQLALKAGYNVYIAGSGDPAKIALSTQIITPGAVAVTAHEAVERADIVLLALPLGKFRTLDKAVLENKLVIDGMNHWYDVDGSLEEIVSKNQTTSRAVQNYLADAIVVKALNHMGYHHLRDEAKPRAEASRKAIAVAGDDKQATQQVEQFVDSLGFDPLFIGGLDESRVLETGQPGFGVNVGRAELKQVVMR